MSIAYNEHEKLWVEKYRPTKIEDCILKEKTRKEFTNILETGHIPNMLLSGPPGSGKTTTAKALCKELDLDWMIINASNERGLDVIREKIMSFASTVSLGGNGKCFILDECLEENEYVRVGTVDDWKPVKLKDMEFGQKYPIVSFNMETGEYENDIGELISDKIDDLFEVELYDGRTVVVNGKHPFVCKASDGTYYEKSINDGLNENDDIVDC